CRWVATHSSIQRLSMHLANGNPPHSLSGVLARCVTRHSHLAPPLLDLDTARPAQIVHPPPLRLAPAVLSAQMSRWWRPLAPSTTQQASSAGLVPSSSTLPLPWSGSRIAGYRLHGVPGSDRYCRA